MLSLSVFPTSMMDQGHCGSINEMTSLRGGVSLHCVEQWVAGQATYFTSLGSDAVGAYRYTHKKGYLLAENLGGLKWKHLLF